MSNWSPFRYKFLNINMHLLNRPRHPCLLIGTIHEVSDNLCLLFCTIFLIWTWEYYLECAFLTNQSRLYYLQHLFYLALKSAKWSSISLRLLTEFFLEWSSKFFENEIEKEMLCSLRRAFLFYQHFQLTVKTRPRLCTSKINFTWKGSFSNSEHCLLTIVCKNLCLEWLNFVKFQR